MAVVSSAVSEQKESKHKEKLKTSSKKEMKSSPVKKSPAKRNSCPGIRVVGGRIYDSQNGKTCHQCRQKTMDITAACMNVKKDKPCIIRFCHKCLWNRYGEKAEEVSKVGDWNCPKCRGICNCSFCMKKRGHQPTGQLALTAKASGFSSVSEMLQVKGPENVVSEKVAKDAATEETKIASPRKRGKENLYDGNVDSNLQAATGVKKSKKVGTEEFKEMCKSSANDDTVLVKVTTPPQETKRSGKVKGDSNMDKGSFLHKLHPDEKKPKKLKSNGLENKNEVDVANKTIVNGTSPRKPEVFKKERITKVCGNQQKENNTKKNLLKEKCSGIEKGKEENDCDADIPVPQGIELATVVGIDIPPEDVGHALQFLEFCSVFGKVLDVKKGQAEAVLRDIIQGRNVRRGKYSVTVQFLVNLLSFIHEEQEEGSPTLSPTNGKNSWIHALKQCISESHIVAKLMELDILDGGADVYESLSSSKKLRLLNFLCDEVLETVTVRDWIEEQNAKFAESVKETRDKIHAAKDKKKLLKKKMQDDIAKAIIAKKGAPLSISEHETIVSQIKHETAEAEAEVLESQGLLSKNNQSCDAVRIEPILLDIDGRVYWRLKCYSDRSDMLLQDVGSGDALALDEKWFAFDVDQKETIEQHLTSLRRKRLRAQRQPKIPCQGSEAQS